VALSASPLLTVVTVYEDVTVIRWVVVVFLALILINGLLPLLKRFGVGRIPGDFELKAFGRVWPIPLGSTLVLSGLLSLLTRWF
jgi:hypothetical protein